LDYHPGNRIFDEYVNTYGGQFFHSVVNGKSFPKTLAGQIIENGVDMMKKHYNSRFLEQDYRTGDWRVMNRRETETYIQMRLFVGTDNLFASLKKEIDVMMDEFRFGLSRDYLSMSWQSQLHAASLGRILFTAWPRRMDVDKPKTQKKGVKSLCPTPFLPTPPKHNSARVTDKNGVRDFLMGRSYPAFQFGDEVDFLDADNDFELYPGTIIGISKNGGYDIAFYGESVSTQGTVRRGVLRPLIITRGGLAEGTRIMANHMGKGVYYSGTIMLILADGSVTIEYDDGDEEEGIPFWEYHVQ
jgi:hypothetical protein